MKILFISPSFYPATYYGGPIYSTYEFAKSLKRIGIDIKVITSNANGKERLSVKTGVWYKLEYELLVKYYMAFNSKGTSFSMLLNVWKEIKEVDLVYLVSIFSAPTPIAVLYSKLLKKVLIIAPKGQIDKWCMEQGSKFKKLWLNIFIRPFINNIYWHTTSEDEQKNINVLFKNAHTFIIKHGINMNSSGYTEKKQRDYFNRYTEFNCSDKNIIISMGRIHKKKGYDILIQAIEILLMQSNDYLLFIAGTDFGAKHALIDMIKSKHLSDKVFFTGHIEGEEKKNFFHNADVFALASYDENFGIVYAEALAVGTPIVASHNTPWQDVEKYKCGKWVENTPEKFAKAIDKILKSDPEQMGRNGSKYVEENFSWENIGNQFKEVVKTII